MRRSGLWLVWSLFVCLAAPSPQAQNATQNPPNATPLIRANAQAVAVDVVVTRGSDEPVLSIRQQDFQVFEDGKPQTIDLFEEHTAPLNAAKPAPPQLPPGVYANRPTAPQTGAVNVLLLDSLNTEPQDLVRVRKQIDDFLRGMSPGVQAAIFNLSSKLELVQGFTADASLLRAALQSKAARSPSSATSRTRDDDLRDKEELSILGEMSFTRGGESLAPMQAIARSQADLASSQAGRRSTLTLIALKQLARTLSGIRGRKNLIWFASTFPIAVFPDGPNRQTLANGRDIDAGVRETANLLTQAKIAIYPVSAAGTLSDATMNADSAGQPNGDDFERSPLQQTAANGANAAAMEQLARDTGGEALYTSNRLDQEVTRAIQNGAHYYTLVYTPPGTQMDGRFHSIEVKLTAGKAKLSYRRGYYADLAAAAQPAADPLAPLLAHGMPASTQVLYQARVLPLSPQPAPGTPRAGGNTKLPGPITRTKVDLVIDTATVVLDSAPDGTHNGKIEVALVAYTASGEIANWIGQTLAISLNAADYEKARQSGMPIHLLIDLPQTDVSLSSGVYDLTARRAGTLEIQLQPRFTAAAL